MQYLAKLFLMLVVVLFGVHSYLTQSKSNEEKTLAFYVWMGVMFSSLALVAVLETTSSKRKEKSWEKKVEKVEGVTTAIALGLSALVGVPFAIASHIIEHGLETYQLVLLIVYVVGFLAVSIIGTIAILRHGGCGLFGALFQGLIIGVIWPMGLVGLALAIITSPYYLVVLIRERRSFRRQKHLPCHHQTRHSKRV